MHGMSQQKDGSNVGLLLFVRAVRKSDSVALSHSMTVNDGLIFMWVEAVVA
jgi:hypothetical protein